MEANVGRRKWLTTHSFSSPNGPRDPDSQTSAQCLVQPRLPHFACFLKEHSSRILVYTQKTGLEGGKCLRETQVIIVGLN